MASNLYTAPDFTVVVVVHNDAERLPRAVQSVLDQTLHSVEVVIVDDCSTDTTFEVAQRIAAREPERVRAFQLPENSGSGGEPRNRGIQEARGRYLMFLDSDDVLDPSACRNMLAAVERTGADVVSGVCKRVYVDRRNRHESVWLKHLYERQRVLESVDELPDLFNFDTLSTNKCYRTDFLRDNELTFPKGLLYEDLLFTAAIYLAADRIALIPHTVYLWYVYENAEVKSVTNSRHQIRNFADRVEIHRRINALLAQGNHVALREAKDVKFLKNDLLLYLTEVPKASQEWRDQFAELACAYLDEISPTAYDEIIPLLRVAVALLRHRDWERLVAVVDQLKNPTKVAAPLFARDGRVYWCEDYLDDERSRELLDVTSLGLQGRSLSALNPRNQLTLWEPKQDGLRLGGRIVNPLGQIPASAKLSAHLEFKARRRGLQVFRSEVSEVRYDGTGVEWSADVNLRTTLRPLGLIDTVWDPWLVLKVGDQQVRTQMTVDSTDIGEAGFPARPRLSRAIADTLLPEVSARGHLAFQLVAEGPTARTGRDLLFRGAKSSLGRPVLKAARKAAKVQKKLSSDQMKLRRYHDVLTRLPVRKGTVVFESHLGLQYSDSPRAVYEEMRRRGLPIEAVWSYANSTRDFPKDATLVRRNSWRYLLALARAEFWIDNQGFPQRLAKRPETTYVQTWHGSALKRMGLDQPEFRRLSKQDQQRTKRAIERFDHFLVRTEHDVRTLARAFEVPERKLLRCGYPRNDALVAARQDEVRTGRRERGPLAAKLGIGADATVILYAPTFRSVAAGAPAPTPQLDLEAFAEQLGDDCVLLVRSHYLQRLPIPPVVRGRVVDVTDQPDITPLMAMADILVTDYSSVMFDYALLDRPMVFYTYDYEEYAKNSRGTYFDLLERAPGPVVHTQDELFTALREASDSAEKYADERRRFVEEFGEYDRGTAAAAVVDALFGPESHG